MTTAFQIFTQPSQQALDNAASVLAGATLTFSQSGSSTPTNAYSDAALTIPLSNPLSADAAGVWVQVFLDPTVPYRIVLKTAAGVLLKTWDPANELVLTSISIAAVLDSLKITAAEIAVGFTPSNYAYPPGDIRRAGALNDGVTDCQSAITNTIAVASQTGGPEVLIPAGGVYVHSGTLDWSFSNLRVRATGGARLKHTGTGVANTIGTGAQAFYNISMMDVHEVGNANTTYAFDMRQLGHCHFRLRGQNCSLAPFRGRFMISNRFELVHSKNETAFTTVPVNTLILDNDGTPGNFAGYNVFSSLVSEGVTQYGIFLGEAVGNLFKTGTSEGNGGGVTFATNANYNTFQNFDCEQNTASPDFSIQGTGNQFHNCNSVSSAITDSTDILNADGTIFIGGFHRSVNVRSTATNTAAYSLRTSDNVSLGIHGAGACERHGTMKCDISGVFTSKDPDVMGETAAFTPIVLGATTAGATTYVSQRGIYQKLGNAVTFRLKVQWSAQTGTGNLLIGGLPTAFPASNTDSSPVSILADSLTFAGQLSAAVKPNSTQIEIFSQATAAGVANVAVDTAATVWISGVYFI